MSAAPYAQTQRTLQPARGRQACAFRALARPSSTDRRTASACSCFISTLLPAVSRSRAARCPRWTVRVITMSIRAPSGAMGRCLRRSGSFGVLPFGVGCGATPSRPMSPRSSRSRPRLRLFRKSWRSSPIPSFCRLQTDRSIRISGSIDPFHPLTDQEIIKERHPGQAAILVSSERVFSAGRKPGTRRRSPCFVPSASRRRCAASSLVSRRRMSASRSAPPGGAAAGATGQPSWWACCAPVGCGVCRALTRRCGTSRPAIMRRRRRCLASVQRAAVSYRVSGRGIARSVTRSCLSVWEMCHDE
jgi:hypothetical protein